MVAFAPDVKLVVHRRVDYAPGQSWLTRRKYFSPFVMTYIAISNAIADVLRETGIPEERISLRGVVIPNTNGQHILKLLPAKFSEINFKFLESGVLICNTSALTDQKNYHFSSKYVGS